MMKWIYSFGYLANDGKIAAEGNKEMKDLLGSKGANLAEMANIGIAVPPGFTLSSKLCEQYYNNDNRDLPAHFDSEIEKAIKKLEKSTGKSFGGKEAMSPLLVSVRSGAKISMPGMMDTILNLGMNEHVAENLAKQTGDERFAFDCYRRFCQMYGEIVLGISGYLFQDALESVKLEANATNDQQLSTSDLREVIVIYKEIIRKQTGQRLPDDPREQLKEAVRAVLNSWMSSRAIIYRKINNIPEVGGTAVNIQSMVYGNSGDSSATGVLFTRDPATGKRRLYGEYLINAQGEDVVSGTRMPEQILKQEHDEGTSLEEKMPTAFKQLADIAGALEEHYGDMQDIEFTIENNKLYILQTRSGKRAAAAAVKIAVDMVSEGKISKQEALLRIDPEGLNQLLHTSIDYKSKPDIMATGLPASPGAATGIVVFSAHDAEELSHHHNVILIRTDTSPEDIHGMHVSQGIVTARGGMTSHAAVVARGIGTPCVCGVRGLVVNEYERFFQTESGLIVKHGETITIDGSRGNIIKGQAELIEPEFSSSFETILEWSDDISRMKVRANAETPLDTKAAINFGAVGIGLCRTEHMFFDADKIPLVREMIIAQDVERKAKAIEKLLPLQMADFYSLLQELNGKPINIRLLDPPLHEFLPHSEADKKDMAKRLNIAEILIEQRLKALSELNPMLGHRGCRLGISHPEIYLMQVEAIIQAAKKLRSDKDIRSNIEIMIPLVMDKAEILLLKELIEAKLRQLLPEQPQNEIGNIKIGTMIELPRAALLAGDIAPHVEFFSFGTNDLTQTTYGISRDDIGAFLPDYLEKKMLPVDPFVQIDEVGVGELLQIATKRGLANNSKISIAVCGEHAGNPASIGFFNSIGVDYISCSPYRVPIARVAAARSSILQQNDLKNSK